LIESRCGAQPAEVSAKLTAEVERIETHLGELEEVDEDDRTDEIAAEAAQLEERRTETDVTIESLAVFTTRTGPEPAVSSIRCERRLEPLRAGYLRA
jgi:hypothetical protein